MIRWIGRKLWIGAGLLALVVSALVAIPSLIDANAYKPQIIALNKGDLLGDELMEDIAAQLREAGAEDIHIISGATGEGVSDLLDIVIPILGDRAREAKPAQSYDDDEGEEGEPEAWSPI